MTWTTNFDKYDHIWYWNFELPNGWVASVIDDSEFYSLPTRYTAHAISKDECVRSKVQHDTLAEAKVEALQLALSQKVCTG